MGLAGWLSANLFNTAPVSTGPRLVAAKGRGQIRQDPERKTGTVMGNLCVSVKEMEERDNQRGVTGISLANQARHSSRARPTRSIKLGPFEGRES